jgi:hypothetical protein
MYNIINLFNDCPDIIIHINKNLNDLSYIMLKMTCQYINYVYHKKYITNNIVNQAIDTQNLNILEWIYDMVGARFDCHYVIKKNYVDVMRWMSTKLGVALWKHNTLSLYTYIISIDILKIYDENDYDFSRSRLCYLSKLRYRQDIYEWIIERNQKRLIAKQDHLDYKDPDKSKDEPDRRTGFRDL